MIPCGPPPLHRERVQAPVLGSRENIVVITDAAHRSQYGIGGRVRDKVEICRGFASTFIESTSTQAETKVRSKQNLVLSQSFAEKLRKTLNGYPHRAITTMEVIEMAKEMDAATKRGEDLGLPDDEVALCDALAENASAVKAMGDDKRKAIAAKIRVMVKRILNKYGYPAELPEKTAKTLLQQAELRYADWV